MHLYRLNLFDVLRKTCLFKTKNRVCRLWSTVLYSLTYNAAMFCCERFFHNRPLTKVTIIYLLVLFSYFFRSNFIYTSEVSWHKIGVILFARLFLFSLIFWQISQTFLPLKLIKYFLICKSTPARCAVVVIRKRNAKYVDVSTAYMWGLREWKGGYSTLSLQV